MATAWCRSNLKEVMGNLIGNLLLLLQ